MQVIPRLMLGFATGLAAGFSVVFVGSAMQPKYIELNIIKPAKAKNRPDLEYFCDDFSNSGSSGNPTNLIVDYHYVFCLVGGLFTHSGLGMLILWNKHSSAI